jgi:FG-GAP-like repeat/Lectin C-type domain
VYSFYGLRFGTEIMNALDTNLSTAIVTGSSSPLANAAATTPPQIVVRQASALGNGNNVLDPNLRIIPGAGSTTADTIDGAQVLLGSAGSDTLGILVNNALQASGTESGINWSFDANQDRLSLTGTASIAAYETLLRRVAYSGSTVQAIDISLGRPVYRSANNHYYEYVPFAQNEFLTWEQARGLAASRTLFGLQGYLLTVTTDTENQFVNQRLQGQGTTNKGWLGGSDVGIEGEWRWVTGPENGTLFWRQASNPQTQTYANWSAQEPNDFAPGEDYAHFLADGTWNDLALSPDPNQTATFIPNGYWVEYGGLTNEPDLAPSRARTQLVPANQLRGQPDLFYHDTAAGFNIFAYLDGNTIAIDSRVVRLNTDTGAEVVTGPGWKVIGLTDLDADGKKDFIWQNQSTGRISLWRMGGDYNNVIIGGGDIAIDPGPTWGTPILGNLIGSPTSAPELVWVNSATGETAVWEIGFANNAASLVSSGFVKLPGATANFALGANHPYKLKGSGNFDGNATTRELVWVNSVSTAVFIWQLEADTLRLTAGPEVTRTGAGWELFSIGDLDKDGRDDIGFQNLTPGQLNIVFWKMNGAQISTAAALGSPGDPATIGRFLVDMNGDGTLDLVARNKSADETYAYILSSQLFAGANPLSDVKKITVNNATTTYNTSFKTMELDGVTDLGGPQAIISA